MPAHTTTKPLCSISDLLGPPRKWSHWRRDLNRPFELFPWTALCGTTCNKPANQEERANPCPDCLRILNQGR